MKKEKPTAAARAAARARKQLAGAANPTQAEPQSVELTFGEEIAGSLRTTAANVMDAGEENAATIARVLNKMADDDMLGYVERGEGTLDYLISQVEGNISAGGYEAFGGAIKEAIRKARATVPEEVSEEFCPSDGMK